MTCRIANGIEFAIPNLGGFSFPQLDFCQSSINVLILTQSHVLGKDVERIDKSRES